MGDKEKTICIVGHGPSPVGERLGTFVDGHDVVIRMAEWSWQPEEDYGSKYDVGVYCKGPSEQFVGRGEKGPRFGYWRYQNEAGTSGKQEGLDIWSYARPFFNTRHLSRGLAALVTTLQVFPCEYITLFGFDAVRKGQYDKSHHPSKFKKFLGDRKAKTNTHDWKAEKRLIDTLVHEYDLLVRWAP